MNIKIAWIDDEIPKMESHVKTLELLGYNIYTFQRTKDFLKWLADAEDTSVDAFFVDLMMKIDDESLSYLSKLADKKFPGDVDTGIVLIGAIREKFVDKPIVVLTVVSNPPMDLFSSDKKIRLVHKVARIKPALDAITELLEDK